MSTFFNFGPSSWELWGIIAIFLAFCEILDGSGHVLSVGIAAGLMAVYSICAALLDLNLIPNWKIAVVEFSFFTILSIVVLKKIQRSKHQPPDINSY